MNNQVSSIQYELWPDWVADHPWLVDFLARAENEARYRGDTCCDHFHMELAFLRLGPPASEWLARLGVDAETLREDVIEILGMNARASQIRDANTSTAAHDGIALAFVARGERAQIARQSANPIEDMPLESVDELYTSELLELAKAEARCYGDPIDARHMLIGMAMLLCEGSPPPLSALRYLVGLSALADERYDERWGDHRQFLRELARSHKASPDVFPYDINGRREA